MTSNTAGIILVSDNGITVRFQECGSTTEVTYTKVTIENLQDATRILAAWMDVKFEDTASECRRVHRSDQRDAYIREFIKDQVELLGRDGAVREVQR